MNSPVIRAIIFAARGLCFAPQKLAHSLREIHNVRRFLLSPIGEPLTHARNHWTSRQRYVFCTRLSRGGFAEFVAVGTCRIKKAGTTRAKSTRVDLFLSSLYHHPHPRRLIPFTGQRVRDNRSCPRWRRDVGSKRFVSACGFSFERRSLRPFTTRETRGERGTKNRWANPIETGGYMDAYVVFRVKQTARFVLGRRGIR